MKYFIFLIIFGISVVSIGCNSIDNKTSKVEVISQKEVSPPDISENGILQTNELWEKHRTYLDTTTYQELIQVDMTIAGYESKLLEATILQGKEGKYIVANSEKEDAVVEIWTTENITALKTDNDLEYLYFHGDIEDASFIFDEKTHIDPFFFWVTSTLKSIQYKLTNTLEQDDEILFEFTGFVTTEADSPQNENNENLESKLILDEQGVIRKIEHYSLGEIKESELEELEGIKQEVNLNYNISKLGQSIQARPQWVVTELPLLNVSLIEDGKVIKIEHQGGASLPMNTVLSVKDIDDLEVEDRFDEGARLNQEISAGETFYVYTTKADCCSLKIAINSPPQIDSSSGFDFSSKELELKLSHDSLSWTFQLPEIF